MPAIMLLLCFVGLYCLARGLLAMPADPLGSLAAPGLLLSGCVLFLVWAVWKGPASSVRPATRRTPFGADADEHWCSRADVQRHEDGHAKLLNKYGVGVAWFGKVVYRVGDLWAGYTMPASWGKFEKLPREKQIAVYHAGHVEQHNKTARSSDDEENIKRIANGDAALEARGRRLAERDLGRVF